MSLCFYKISSEYCDFLREYDSGVPKNSYEKQNRPFIGIVLKINDKEYYAPLTSPKPKHLHMKNQVDFIKINKGEYGAINFNNMIPVPLSCISKIDVKIKETDTTNEVKWKKLLHNQLKWCNSNEKQITTKAKKLYNLISSGKVYKEIKQRCCNFLLLEEKCEQYINIKENKIPKSEQKESSQPYISLKSLKQLADNQKATQNDVKSQHRSDEMTL